MAIINALKAGNWSDTTVWPGGTLPGPTDQVQANGYAITINQDITVASIRTTAEGGGAAGGYYTTENGRTITADIVCGSNFGMSQSNVSYTVIGNIYGSTTDDYEPIRTNSSVNSTITVIGNVVASYGHGINNIGIATIIVTGNVTGGANSSKYGIFNNSTGSVTVTGNVTGGSGASAHGIHNLSTGSVTVTGNVTGGSGSSAIGVNNHSSGTVTVTGNATGGAVGTGIQNNTGTLSVTGNAIASFYIRGITSGGAGPIDLIGTAIGNDWKLGDPGNVIEGISGHPNGSIFRRVTVSAIKYGAYGSPPTSGNVFIKKTATSTATMTDNDGNLVTLVTSDSICDFPAVSNVRLNTAFDNSNKVGTCAVPAAAAVSLGVAVDNTTGTAILDGASVRAAIGMSSANLDTQIGNIPTSVWASTTRTLSSFGTLIADIWSYATRTITSGGITVAEIWDSLLTSILTSGSIGKLIKDNLNATVSSRSTFDRSTESVVASNMVSEPPTVTAIRQEIDNNSTKLTSILADTNELQTDWANGGRLDLLLDTVAVPAGTNTITITINDGTDPISDVSVYIYDNTDAVFITNKTTNTSGVATFYLNDGSYKVRLKKAGVTFTSPESLTVFGNTTDIYSGETVNIGAPDDSDVCRVYEYCYEQDGSTPLMSVTATAMIKSIPYDYDNKLHSTQSTTGIYDATSGFLYWDIVRGCRVLVTITELGISSYVDIPDASTARLANLL